MTPPRREALRSEAGKALRDSTIMPPLGLLRVYSALTADGHEVRLLDADAMDWSDSLVLREIEEFGPRVLGIGTTTAQLVDALRVCRLIKAHDERITTVLGGPHVKYFPTETAMQSGVDVVLRGEADLTMPQLVATLRDGGEVTSVSGVFTKRGDAIVEGPPAAPVPDLDALAPVDRTPVRHITYRDPAMPGRLASVEMVRGCPYDCSFCSTPRGLVRHRSAGNMADEMTSIVRNDLADSIYFVDDTWNVHKVKSKAFCEELIRRDFKTPWAARLRINTMSDELMGLMAKAGCVRVQLGVEASTDESMATLSKRLKVEQVRKAFKMAHDAGIDTLAYFMIGLPDDRTVEDVRKTVHFARDLSPTYAVFNVFTPYPTTTLYDEGVKRNIVDDSIWRDFTRNPTRDFAPQPWTEHLPADTLYRELKRAYRSFYFRPVRILKQLARPSSWTRAAHAAVGMLRG
ncbi:MAG: B12-binding domain-containing radical SAM protein [Deltaproteobacteria bacterium]|nr:B12-binding domain-containing radical SAM protein [Deltaproteobacteria bacterium]